MRSATARQGQAQRGQADDHVGPVGGEALCQEVRQGGLYGEGGLVQDQGGNRATRAGERPYRQHEDAPVRHPRGVGVGPGGGRSVVREGLPECVILHANPPAPDACSLRGRWR